MIINFDPDVVLDDEERKLTNILAQQEINDLKECVELFKYQLSNTTLFSDVNVDFIVPNILNQIKKYFINQDINNLLNEQKELEVFESYNQRYDIEELKKVITNKK